MESIVFVIIVLGCCSALAGISLLAWKLFETR